MEGRESSRSTGGFLTFLACGRSLMSPSLIKWDRTFKTILAITVICKLNESLKTSLACNTSWSNLKSKKTQSAEQYSINSAFDNSLVRNDPFVFATGKCALTVHGSTYQVSSPVF